MLLANHHMPRMRRRIEALSGGGSSSKALTFDKEQKRIAFGGEWVNFHDRPLLFAFLAQVYGRKDFVSKELLAKHLWSSEIYKPKVHDPRLFDVARRIRALLLTLPVKGLTLLSGRLGYLLVISMEEESGEAELGTRLA